jgi:hypothetical protein
VGSGEDVETHEGDRHLIFPNGRRVERSEEEEKWASHKGSVENQFLPVAQILIKKPTPSNRRYGDCIEHGRRCRKVGRGAKSQMALCQTLSREGRFMHEPQRLMIRRKKDKLP